MKPNSILSEDEWYDLYRLVQQQATIGVCYKSLYLLSKEQMPPRTILLQWAAQVNYIQETNKRIENVYHAIEGELGLLGVSVAVMKGMSFASYYPIPALRMCGDLDLFIPDKYDKAIAYFKHQGYALSESSQHVSLEFKGVHVELHHHIINPPFKEYKGYSLVRRETEQHIKYTTFDTLTQAILLLTHAATHLAGPGISFRFLNDWAFFLQKHGEILNNGSFLYLVKQSHLFRFVSVFTTVTSEHLGITHPISIPQNYSFLFKQLVKDMFRQGDCGQIERLHRNKMGIFTYYISIMKRIFLFSYFSPILSLKIIVKKMFSH